MRVAEFDDEGFAEIRAPQGQNRAEPGTWKRRKTETFEIVVAFANVPAVKVGERSELRFDALIILPALQDGLSVQHCLLALDRDDGGGVADRQGIWHLIKNGPD